MVWPFKRRLRVLSKSGHADPEIEREAGRTLGLLEGITERLTAVAEDLEGSHSRDSKMAETEE